jgi:hypothetical protein
LVAPVWVQSKACGLGFMAGRGGVQLNVLPPGTYWYQEEVVHAGEFFHAPRDGGNWNHWRFESRMPPCFIAAVPLWVPLVIAGGPAAALWRADIQRARRARPGHCPSCGYDRSGLTADSPCPECGTAPARG